MQGGEKLWKGALAGAAAGLAASWTMNQFQAGWSKIQQGIRAALGRDTWNSRLKRTLRSNATTLKSHAKKAKNTIVHWEVEQRTGLPKNVSRLKKAVRQKWEAA